MHATELVASALGLQHGVVALLRVVVCVPGPSALVARPSAELVPRAWRDGTSQTTAKEDSLVRRPVVDAVGERERWAGVRQLAHDPREAVEQVSPERALEGLLLERRERYTASVKL